MEKNDRLTSIVRLVCRLKISFRKFHKYILEQNRQSSSLLSAANIKKQKGTNEQIRPGNHDFSNRNFHYRHSTRIKRGFDQLQQRVLLLLPLFTAVAQGFDVRELIAREAVVLIYEPPVVRGLSATWLSAGRSECNLPSSDSGLSAYVNDLRSIL